MSVIIKLFLIATIISITGVIRAEHFIANAKDYDNPDNCYHKELQLSIRKGDYLRPINTGHCLQLNCLDDGVILVNECPSRAHKRRYSCSNILLPVDYTKEFPDCCGRMKCA